MEEEEYPGNSNDKSGKVLATPSNTPGRKELIPRAPRKKLEAWRKRQNKREEERRRRDMTNTDPD